MSRRGSQVDFGPLSLPVGDMPFFEGLGVTRACLKDVERLHQLLSQQRDDGQREQWIPIEPAEVSPCGMDLHQTHILASLAEFLPGLATSPAVKTQSQAVILISSDLLADAQLTVVDTGLRIEFFFQIGDDRERHWLQQHVAWLAKTVGERLARDVRVSVSSFFASGAHRVVEDWLHGMEA